MTDRQRQIYKFIVEYIQEHLYPPTIREIGDKVGLASTSSVYAHLLKIQEYWFIEVKMNSPRAIRVKGYKFVKETVND